MDTEDMLTFLKTYNGPELKIMEVCGTHTSAIFKSGIRGVISPAIKLISGPGCPVCVTPASYIDRCCEYALKPYHTVLSFGDMFKVPGISGSLASVKADGGNVELMYSPMEAIKKSLTNPDTIYVVAAVGFETTAVAYALLMDDILKNEITNIKLLTALKTVLPALKMIVQDDNSVDGFICPGHVSVITGSEPFKSLADQYDRPFIIAGFQEEHLISAIYAITRSSTASSQESGVRSQNKTLDTNDANGFGGKNCQKNKLIEDNYIARPSVASRNLYPSVVKPSGNTKALALISEYFCKDAALWRGIGNIPDSGLYLREDYADYDCNSRILSMDHEPEGCRCGDVITGKIDPLECEMFGSVCTPEQAMGPCMVTAEGACGIWYQNQFW